MKVSFSGGTLIYLIPTIVVYKAEWGGFVSLSFLKWHCEFRWTAKL